jgi:hypothetical protein
MHILKQDIRKRATGMAFEGRSRAGKVLRAAQSKSGAETIFCGSA